LLKIVEKKDGFLKEKFGRMKAVYS